MANLALVQDHKSFENLGRDVPRARLSQLSADCNELAQIAVLDILHGNMDRVGVLEPPQERHK